MSIVERILTRLCGEPEEINGAGVCPTYLYRWTLSKTRYGSVYLHKFVGDDWSRDLHDHPKRFITIGLRGAYRETTPEGKRLWRAPWIRMFEGAHTHRVELSGITPCWTLVIVGQRYREWGFWLPCRTCAAYGHPPEQPKEDCLQCLGTGTEWIPWDEYVRDHGQDRKGC